MNKQKLEKMEQEFPFLKEFLAKNFGEFLKDKKTSLEIKVERIDANLLFYRGDHADGHQSRFLKEKHYGSLFTSLFFINDIGKTTFYHFGPLREYSLLDIKNISLISRILRGNTINECIHYIIKGEIETWYEYEKDEKGHNVEVFKHFDNRKVRLTIYKEPENGLDSLLNDPDLINKVQITIKLLNSLYYSHKDYYDQIQNYLDELKDKFKPFFEKYLQAPMYKERSFNCEFGSVKFLSVSLAGRLLITLDTPQSQISFMALDEEKGDSRMGVNSIDATLNEAKRITEEIISIVTKEFESGKTFTDIFKTGKVIFAGQEFGKD